MFQLNPNLRPFWKTRKPYKLLKGGRFSSKTQDAGGMAAFLARNFSLKFMCIRQFQNRITDSVYTVIKEKIIAAGWDGEFDIGATSIKHKETGSEFLFYGIARNIAEIKGTEGVDICWIEEGEGLTEDQWAVIDPTIRKNGSEIWILWNPYSQTDFVQTKLPELLGDDCIIRHINYDENPFLSDTARKKAERLKLVDEDSYNHIYLGRALSSDEMSIIKGKWFDASIDAHILIPDFPKGGGKIGGMDISGGIEGDIIAPKANDPNALAWRYGCVLMDLLEWQDENPNAAAAYAHPILLKEGVDTLNIDDIGVGASVPSEFRRLHREVQAKAPGTIRNFSFKGWTASEGPAMPDRHYELGKTHGDMWLNLKAQGWGMLADRFYNTWLARNGLPHDREKMISIPSSLPLREKLKGELTGPRKEIVNGKQKTEGKKALKKRGISSHNLADAVVMAFAHTKRVMSISSEALAAA
ncbi:PBSX family phage terminase large subunit [Sphingobium sp. WCS2017Hpa-17]|uniref:PBSX family phage terminase large subunit n=1 Tax=Sphingobium sp. WCS2017Hpa-17 TaxID=3073638 RepID=UPI0028891B01|nr:PBSX family phage terminase large subunit [Sphingobium sp. WCS2017Hpa-17]